jgi:hypothetical protein
MKCGAIRRAVAVADQKALPETDGVENARQHLARLDMHEVELAR